MLKVAQQWSRKSEISYLLPQLGYSSLKKDLVAGEAIIIDSRFENESSSLLRVVLLYCARLWKILTLPPQKQYDVIVASNHFLIDVIPALYLQSKLRSGKLVAYYHGLPVKESSLWWRLARTLNDMLSVALLRKYFDTIFAINQTVKDFLISQKVDAKKIVITNNGIDPIVLREGYQKPIFEACFVGRLVTSKGVADLVEIWKDVSAKIPGAKLAIVGDGPEMGWIAKRIEKEGLEEHIALFGYLEDERFDVMHSSKLFLLPSYAESWPIVIIEAMGCGLPVVAYDLPELRTVWEDEITYVPKGDRDSFKQSVLSLLENPRLRSKFAENGLKLSKRYLWRFIAECEADAIERV